MTIPFANGRYQKPAGILAGLLCFAGLGVSFLSLWLFMHYDATRPSHFDRTSGRIYAQVNHYHTVYLTKDEHANVATLRGIAIGLFVSGIGLSGVFVEKIRWNPRREPEPWETKRY